MNPDARRETAARRETERTGVVGWRARRWWHRLERHAVAAHQKDLLAAVRLLASAAPEIIDLDARSTSPAQVVRLLLPGRSLTLAGVTPAARAGLTAASAAGMRLRLVEGGRYGRYWWIGISSRQDQIVVAGSRLLLLDTDGGKRLRPANGRPHLPEAVRP